MKPPAPPADLGAESQADWPGLAADVAAVSNGAAIDYELLADVLRVRDRLRAVSAQIDEDGIVTIGSMGQQRANALLTVEGNLRRELAQGWDRLGITPSKRGHYVHITRTGRLANDY